MLSYANVWLHAVDGNTLCQVRPFSATCRRYYRHPKGIPKAGRRNVSPHAGQLQRGHDPRRNLRGLLNAASVALSAQARELYVQVLAEPSDAPPQPPAHSLEAIVRG